MKKHCLFSKPDGFNAFVNSGLQVWGCLFVVCKIKYYMPASVFLQCTAIGKGTVVPLWLP